MADVYDKVSEGLTAPEKLLNFVPGWKGYQERKARRQADKLLRQTLAEKLADQRRQLNVAQKDLIEHGRLDLLDNVESASTQLKTFIDRLRFASYGYAGLFDAVKIREGELKQLYDFDTALIEYVERLDEATKRLRSAIAGGEGVEETVRIIQDIAREANSTFDQREHLLLGSV